MPAGKRARVQNISQSKSSEWLPVRTKIIRYRPLRASRRQSLTNRFVWPLLLGPLAFDAIDQILCCVIASAGLMVVHPSLAARDIREFVALAKSRPGDLTYGSPGVGSPNHLAAESFLQATGTRLVHVPYKGSGPLMVDLRGGHVMMAFDSIMATVPHIKAGKLRAMGIAATGRSPVAPEIPTIAEAGGPEVIIGSWYGVLAPAATPRDIIAKLHAEVVKALATPELRERYVSMGLEPLGNSPDEFAAQIRADIARCGKVARTARVRAE
jgi:tripartite-type tricarboxylate transporter receptor subunit TctC